MRYFNKLTKTEVIPGIHDIESTDVVELEDDNPFFQPLPDGKTVDFDVEGIPVGLADTPEISPSAREVRDVSLLSLTHDFGDGRIMQVRPKDEQNIRNAIEVMEENSISSIGWVMLDNKKYPVTVEELRTALKVGQLAAVEVWNNYEPEEV